MIISLDKIRKYQDGGLFTVTERGKVGAGPNRRYVQVTGDDERGNNRYGKDTSFKTQEANRNRIAAAYEKAKADYLSRADDLVKRGIIKSVDDLNNNMFINEQFGLDKRTTKEFMDWEDHMNAWKNQKETYTRRSDELNPKKKGLSYLAGRFEEDPQEVPIVPDEKPVPIPGIQTKVTERTPTMTKTLPGSGFIRVYKKGAGGHGTYEVYGTRDGSGKMEILPYNADANMVQRLLGSSIKKLVEQNPDATYVDVPVTGQQLQYLSGNKATGGFSKQKGNTQYKVDVLDVQ